MNNFVKASQHITRFVERTERIMDKEQDEHRKEQFRRILQQTIEKMEQRKNGGDIA